MNNDGTYRCEICNKLYASYKSLWNHNKKYHLPVVNNGQHLVNNGQHLVNNSQHLVNNNKNTCNYCNKILSCKQSKSVHQKNCKYKNILITNNNNTINNNTINIINNNNNNNNNNNTINNNTIINNKIIINKIGNENILEIPVKDVLKIFKDEFFSIQSIIELLYFNENLPQNHYFCTTNLESNYSSIYNTDAQKIDKSRKKYLFEEILNNSYNKLKLLYGAYKNRFSYKRQQKIETRIKELNELNIAFFSTKVKKNYVKSINVLSYNNKDLIKSTWVGKAKKRITLEEDLELPISESDGEDRKTHLLDDYSSSDSD